MKRGDNFDAIIVETTGLADPAPVAQTFFVDQEVSDRARLDGIVTVADAVHLNDQLGEHHRGRGANSICRYCPAEQNRSCRRWRYWGVSKIRIRRINPYAKIIKTERCEASLDEVIGLNSFSLDRVLEVEPDFLTSDHDHEHDDDITSISLTSDVPLESKKFQTWFGELLQATRARTYSVQKGSSTLKARTIVLFFRACICSWMARQWVAGRMASVFPGLYSSDVTWTWHGSGKWVCGVSSNLTPGGRHKLTPT